MDLSPSGILAGLLVSSVGYVLFHHGRKCVRTPQLVSGLVLMVFPAFVQGALLVLLLGGAVLGALWLSLRAGL